MVEMETIDVEPGLAGVELWLGVVGGWISYIVMVELVSD